MVPSLSMRGSFILKNFQSLKVPSYKAKKVWRSFEHPILYVASCVVSYDLFVT